MTEFDKLPKWQKTLVAIIVITNEMIEYGMKNPKSDVGRLMGLS